MATAKKKTIPLVPAEVVPSEEQAQQVPMFDHTKALMAYDPIEAGLQALRDMYAGIKIAGPDDNVNYSLATDAVKNLTSRRTLLEKKRKELKADALEYGRKVDGKAKEIETAIREIEDPLKKRIDEINAEREARKRAKETARIKALTENGFTLVGQTYQVGNVGDFFDNIMDLDEEAFADFVAKGVLEADRLEREAAALKAQQEAMAAQAADLERLKRELESKIAQFNTMQAAATPAPQAEPFRAAEPDRAAEKLGQPVDIWDAPAPQGPKPTPLPMSQFADYSDNVLGTNYGGSNPEHTVKPGTEAQSVAAAKQTWFNDGWEACKNRIIKIFTEDQTPRKRAEWVEIFRNLKP